MIIKAADDAKAGLRLAGLVAMFAPMSNPDFSPESLLPQPATKAEDFLDLDYLQSMFAYRTITQVARISPTLLPIRFDSCTMHLARFWDG